MFSCNCTIKISLHFISIIHTNQNSNNFQLKRYHDSVRKNEAKFMHRNMEGNLRQNSIAFKK
jgi:hypothetical protein